MPEQPEDTAVRGVSEGRTSQPLYTRPMPGGGEVRVEILVDRERAPSDVMRGRVVMERRSQSRGAAATPLVVEELEGHDANDVVAELFRIARDNAAIARRVLRRDTTEVRAD